MTWDPQTPRRKEILAQAGSDRLPAVRVVVVSEQAKGDAALAVVERVLARPEDQRRPLSDVEWAALRHVEAMAARVNSKPGLRRLGFAVELSPYLRALLEGGR